MDALSNQPYNGSKKLWLGLPASEPDLYQGPWEKAEHWVLWLALFWILLCLMGTMISSLTSDETIAYIFSVPLADDPLWDRLLKQIPATFFVYTLFGLLVEKLGVNVVFTRKAGHIAFIFILPLLVSPEIKSDLELYREWYIALTWYSLFGFIVPYALLIRPLRSRIKPFYYVLRAFDRPEDRPYTLIWFISQMLAISLIQIPMTQHFVSEGLWSLYLIAAFANGLGDGLAEPIGKIYGKRKYKVIALFTNRQYTRSYAGSACVFIATAVGVAINYNVLSGVQFLFLIMILPALMTLIEAKSPHTWDNFFLYGACWIVILIALQL